MDFFRRHAKEFVVAALATQLSGDLPKKDTNISNENTNTTERHIQPPEVLGNSEELLTQTENRTVVLFGEFHNTSEDEDAVLELLPRLHAQGFTTLAIEQSSELQSGIDTFLRGGFAPDEEVAFTRLYDRPELLLFCKQAYDIGFEILFVDERNLDSDMSVRSTPNEFPEFMERDRFMFERIQQAIENEKRIIGFFGALHVSTADRVPNAFSTPYDDSGMMRRHDIEEPLGYRLKQVYGDDMISIEIAGGLNVTTFGSDIIQSDFLYTQ